MPSPPPSASGTAPTIILVEEYHALTVAFRAALQRVAPDVHLEIFVSLSEAEAALAERRPEMVIVDFDPPQRGIVGFLSRLRAVLPEARVLIIAAESVPELGIVRPRAFQIIKKPFALPELAAAIAPILKSAAPDSEPIGTLRQLSLIDLALLHAAGAATTVLKVESTGGRNGEIHFADGRIWHAVAMGQQGIQALQEMLAWRESRYGEADRRSDAPRTIKGDWQSILVQAWRAAETDVAIAPGEPAAIAPEPRSAGTPPRHKLVVVDDTEMLLIFVEEMLASADARFDILTAKSGREGIERITEVKPDLILLDYELSDMNGGEVCRRLLEEEGTARIPIIMMSGHVGEMIAVAERFENVIATIAKPFLSKELIELVKRTVADLPRLSTRPRKRRKAARTQPGKVQPSNREPESRNGRSDEEGGGPSSEMPPSSAAEPSGPTALQGAQLRPAAALTSAPSEVENVNVSGMPAARGREMASGGPQPARTSFGVAPAGMHEPRNNAVILHLPLEVASLQFSPSLRITAIRARPSSQLVSLQILADMVSGAAATEAGFEIAAVELDARGHMELVRLVPVRRPLPTIETETEFPVQNLVVLTGASGHAAELTPMPVAMRMQLLAPFDICGVELSPEFGVGHLLLKARAGEMRVSLQPDDAQTGATFESAQVLLDGSARIAEVRLDNLL